MASLTDAYVLAVDPALTGSWTDVMPPSLTDMLQPMSPEAAAASGRACLAVLVPLGPESTMPDCLSDSGLPLIQVDPARPDQMIDDLMALLLGRLRADETAAAEARAEAALLRRDMIAVTGRFREIENFLHGLGNPQVSQSLSWEPQGAMAELAPEAVVVQRLPLNIVSITAVELWLPERLHMQDCDLEVALLDSGGRRHILTEIANELRIGTGWVRFILPGAMAGDASDCSLVLRNSGPEPLPVGLGLRMPGGGFAAQGDTMPGDRALALRVWKALAGARLPEPQGAPLIDPRQDLEARVLQASSLPAPEIFSMPRLAQDYTAAAYWQTEDAFMVHPSRSGTVCAVIRDVPMPGLRQLSALVTAGHARSPSLNFAIGVTPRGALGRDGHWESCLGPWVHSLPAHGWAQAHCVPSTPIDRADIYLATSLAQDLPNDHSWGLFSSFRIVTSTRDDG